MVGCVWWLVLDKNVMLCVVVLGEVLCPWDSCVQLNNNNNNNSRNLSSTLNYDFT